MANRNSRSLNDIQAAYRQVFKSEDGETVLGDLQKRFHVNSPTFVAGDPHESAFLEGQRSVVLTIQHIMENKLEQGVDEDG